MQCEFGTSQPMRFLTLGKSVSYIEGDQVVITTLVYKEPILSGTVMRRGQQMVLAITGDAWTLDLRNSLYSKNKKTHFFKTHKD